MSRATGGFAVRLAMLMAVCLGAESAQAVSGDVGYSPLAGVRPRSKLSMVVDAMAVEGSGYRPVRVELSNLPLAPAVADRNFQIELRQLSRFGGDDTEIIKGFLTIPQGQASAETILLVPSGGMWYVLHVEVFEGGRPLRDMSLDVSLINQNGNVPFSEGIPAFLVIDKHASTRADRWAAKQASFGGTPRPVATYDLPDIRTLASLNPFSNIAPSDGNQVDDVTIMHTVYSVPNLELASPKDLAESWLNLTSFDVVIVSRSELRELQTSAPKKLDALRDWTAAGGTLCVYDAGEKLEHLTEVEQALGLAPAAPEGKAARGWFAPNTGSFNPAFMFEMHEGQYGYGRGGVVRQVAPSPPAGFMLDQNGQMVPAPNAPPQQYVLPELRLRELQMGRVLAVSLANPFPGKQEQWKWICQNIGKSNLEWPQRHGVSVSADNTDYWDFLIPGVGMAPVTGFRVLISLFVILIGPVNYLLLRRFGRLYLLLVTVPGGAAFVTVCLLGYALVTDGLGVRARVRSYTHLDQRTGSAVSWSRQSYYAGLAPSGGLKYPSDTAVYRIVDRRFETVKKTRALVWTQQEQEQHLQAGYLNSRVTSQFLVVRAHHKSPSRIEITEPAGASPSIENRLGTKILALSLCDSQGTWHTAADIDPGEALELQPCAVADAHTEIRRLIAENPPAEPVGFSPNVNYYGWNRRYFGYGRYYGQQANPPTMRTSLLERGLQVSGPAGGWGLAPRSYVAVVEKSPEVPMGVARAREEASVHVVVGQW